MAECKDASKGFTKQGSDKQYGFASGCTEDSKKCDDGKGLCRPCLKWVKGNWIPDCHCLDKSNNPLALKAFLAKYQKDLNKLTEMKENEDYTVADGNKNAFEGAGAGLKLGKCGVSGFFLESEYLFVFCTGQCTDKTECKIAYHEGKTKLEILCMCH
jgi:hypothetical protein